MRTSSRLFRNNYFSCEEKVKVYILKTQGVSMTKEKIIKRENEVTLKEFGGIFIIEKGENRFMRRSKNIAEVVFSKLTKGEIIK